MAVAQEVRAYFHRSLLVAEEEVAAEGGLRTPVRAEVVLGLHDDVHLVKVESLNSSNWNSPGSCSQRGYCSLSSCRTHHLARTLYI